MERCISRCAVATVLVLAVASTTLAIVWTYDPYTAPEVVTWEGVIYEVPVTASFKAYKGETVTFFSANADKDRKTSDEEPPQVIPIDASTDDFVQHWAIQGKASFSTTSSLKGIDKGTLSSGQVPVYIDNTFASGDTVVVTMTLDDNAPGKDNDGDTARTKSWTITFKTRCPTAMACVDPADCLAEQDHPAGYAYRMDPDVDPPGRPDYQGVSVHESFGGVTSNIDKDVHVTAEGRATNPTWTNAQWRDFYFTGGGRWNVCGRRRRQDL